MGSALLAKAAAVILSNEDLRRKSGWVLVAVLSPVIVLLAFFCALGAGGAEHNNFAIQACFYDSGFSDEAPDEFRAHIGEMQSAFSLLDSAVASVNSGTEDGSSLDSLRVKAVFYALCFGEDAPSQDTVNSFVSCFYTTEERIRYVEVEQEDGSVTTEEESYTVNIPLSEEAAYANLRDLLGRAVTDDDRDNTQHIYSLIAAPSASEGSGGSYDGSYQRGGAANTEIDISDYVDPYRKNAADLAAYAIHAWESGWGYVWGTFGWVLTESALNSKLAQYPDVLGSRMDFIRANWLGGRTTDCVGLIKGYGWLDPDTLNIVYSTNGMPDFSANQMCYTASESGSIDTIPEIPGLAVWMEGHIGVYIGNGEVIESMGTNYGVVKTQLSGRGWARWLKIAYIDYD
ncbi:MAG: hypothetical protein NC319_08805 [Butyricicoccus sp.]|nr:hypothetical protein [Butyricicoccus sp.]